MIKIFKLALGAYLIVVITSIILLLRDSSETLDQIALYCLFYFGCIFSTVTIFAAIYNLHTKSWDED